MPRLFISIDLPEKFVSEIEKLQSRLRRTNADLNFVDPEQAHITMKFLGDTPEERIEEIKRLLDAAVENHSNFRASIEGTGVFPNKDFIKVIWVGVGEGRNEIMDLQSDVEDNLVEAGFAQEEYDFTPHATIARMQSGHAKSQVQDFLDETATTDLGDFDVTDLRLKKSTLKSDGPVYNTLHKSDL